MIGRLAAIALLAAGAAAGQIQLFLRDAPGSEKPLGQIVDFGSVPTGDVREIPLRIRNLGEGAVTLSRLRIQRERNWANVFSLDGHPSIPHVIAPGWNVDFRVRFRPTAFGTYSAVLEVNELSVILIGESPPTAILFVEDRERVEPLASGDTVLFGRIERGSRFSRRFRLAAPAEAAVTVSRLAVGPGPFESPDLPSAPLALRAGEQAEFTVTYAPARAGIHQATLQVDHRSFVLEGVAYDPPMPKPEIQLEPRTWESARQGKLWIRLASPAPAPASGELQLDFEPSVEPAGEDPAIQFVNGKGRSIAFSIREGESAARFGDEEAAIFQTGTTAGTLIFTARLDGHELTVRQSVPIPASVVTVDSASGRRGPGELVVEIRGFDNSRSVSEIVFTFLDAQGRLLPGQPIRANVAEAFRNYFAGATAGGMFALTARFPVNGNPALVSAVEVEFLNRPGASARRRISF